MLYSIHFVMLSVCYETPEGRVEKTYMRRYGFW